jgi:hypothetical protein
LGDFILGQKFGNYLLKWCKFLGYFFHGTSYVLILTKILVGPHLGDFFTNSSGHPAEYFTTLKFNEHQKKQSDQMSA